MTGNSICRCSERPTQRLGPTQSIGSLAQLQLSSHANCSRWMNPGSECIDCCTVSWKGELNWLCPPVHLVTACIRHLIASKADGSLLLPFWMSAVWWPLLCEDEFVFKSLVVECMVLEPHAGMFLSGTCHWNLFVLHALNARYWSSRFAAAVLIGMPPAKPSQEVDLVA